MNLPSPPVLGNNPAGSSRWLNLAVWFFIIGCLQAGTTNTWTGAISSDWFIAGNWTPPAVPAGDDTAVINSGNVSLAADTGVAGLTLNGGTLTGAGVLTVGQTMAWTGGTVAGMLNIPAGATLDIGTGSYKYLSVGTVTNAGTATWSGNDNLYIQNSGNWVNQSTGVFRILGDAVYDYNAGDHGTFVNHGTVRKEGGTGTTTFDQIPFTNAGTVETLAGRIRFPQGLQGGGTFVAAAGAVNEFNGTVGLVDAVFSGEGSNRMSGATVDLSGEIQSTNLEWNGGYLRGTHTLHGSLNWLAGEWQAQTMLAADAIVTINTGGDKYLDGCTITNLGTVEWRAAQNLYNQNAAQWINEPGGVFAIFGDATYDYNAGVAGTFVNRGTVRKEGGTGTTTFDQIAFTNTGNLELVRGVLRINGDYLHSDEAIFRTYLSGPGLPSDFGRLEVSGTVELGGTLEIGFAGDYLPPTNADYPIITAGRVVGTFAAFKSALPGNNLYLNPVYGPTGVRLPMVDPIASVSGDMWRASDGSFHFEIRGVAAQSYRVDASSNLQSWAPISTIVIPASTVFDFVDQDTALHPARFYRVSFVPTP